LDQVFSANFGAEVILTKLGMSNESVFWDIHDLSPAPGLWKKGNNTRSMKFTRQGVAVCSAVGFLFAFLLVASETASSQCECLLGPTT
jgi:hypothetical protein